MVYIRIIKALTGSLYTRIKKLTWFGFTHELKRYKSSWELSEKKLYICLVYVRMKILHIDPVYKRIKKLNIDPVDTKTLRFPMKYIPG